MVVLAVILMLAANAWKSSAPTAIEIHDLTEDPALSDHGEAEAGEEIRSGSLPNLEQMQAATRSHAERLDEAVRNSE